ncbi:hypothetical protein ACNSPD_00470, partial [Yersinia enterocolitica]
KWPTACSLDVFGEACALTLDFDTPWGPPSNDVLSALSRQFDCDVMHYFSESGCGFCGYGEYSKGICLMERMIISSLKSLWGMMDMSIPAKLDRNIL